MRTILLVAAGGATGSIARYLIAAALNARATAFPAGTLAVNAIGCLLIGAVSVVLDARGSSTSDARALLMVGLLGGFTTMSAFALETLNLARDGHILRAGANIMLQVALCLVCVWLGAWAARSIGG